MMATRREQVAADLERTLLSIVARRGPGKTIDPVEIARAVSGDQPEAWAPLMPLVRSIAVRLMKEGRIVILRKGRPVDPDDFRGVYRLAPAVPDDPVQSRGAGKSSSV